MPDRATIPDREDSRPGKRFEFFDDGTVKAEGPVKNGTLHGPWRWYRRDGSLLRVGRFRLGEPVGDWQSFDRSGDPVGTGRRPYRSVRR